MNTSSSTALPNSARNQSPPRWLVLPVRTGHPKKTVRVEQGGRVVRFAQVEFADDDPEFWVGVDVGSALATNSPTTFTLDGEPFIPRIEAELPDQAEAYREPYRPQFHFTARHGWINDPNGLVYHQGTWHLFFQHTPYASSFGLQHWGHAVSDDLTHWKQVSTAVYPTYGPKPRGGAFSGSAIFDENNTLGLTEGPALVIAYTDCNRGQCLAYSHDQGDTWQDYEHNPVLIHGQSNQGSPGDDEYWHDSRDPKVFRYQDSENDHWVMVVYEQTRPVQEVASDVTFAIYVSDDLKTWRKTQVLEGWYECAELFSLPLDGDGTQRKWVMLEAAGFYAIGSFDGYTFTAESRQGDADRPANERRPFINLPDKYRAINGPVYAGQCWNDVPESDGRTVYIGWFQTTPPERSRFSQAMSLPCELSLRTTDDGPRLFLNPATELAKLQSKHLIENYSGSGAELSGRLKQVDQSLLRITGTFYFDAEIPSTLSVNGFELTYTPQTRTLNGLEVTQNDHVVDLDVFVDQGIIEWFVNDGRWYAAASHFHEPEAIGIEQSGIRVESLKVTQLKSIWR